MPRSTDAPCGGPGGWRGRAIQSRSRWSSRTIVTCLEIGVVLLLDGGVVRLGRKQLVEEASGLADRDHENTEPEIEDLDRSAGFEVPAVAHGGGQAHLAGGGHSKGLASRHGLHSSLGGVASVPSEMVAAAG